MQRADTIIFDLGGVLIDWNPRYLYRKLFTSEEEVTRFLETVCTPEWNEQQDAGRPFLEAIEDRIKLFPEHEPAIRAWGTRWPETIGGPIQATVELLKELHHRKLFRLYALTNWSAETFPWAKDNFVFLHWFGGIVVSGEEKTVKPKPEIYKILLERYAVNPERAIFIDDNLKNVEAAQRLGIDGVQFRGADILRRELRSRGIPLRV